MNCLSCWFRRSWVAVCALTLLPGLAAEPKPPLAAAAGISNTTPAELSLETAKALAFQRNWDLLAAASDVDAATAQKLMTKEFPNPVFSWATYKIPIDNQPASTELGNGLWDRSYDTLFSVNQLFEIGGKRRNRQRSADHSLAASQARFDDARRLLDLGVTKGYVAALQAGLNAQALRDSAASLRREADLAALRLRAGDLSAMDKSQIEIQAARFELDAQAAEAAALQQRIALENLIGTPRPSGQWQPTATLESLVGPPPRVDEPQGLPRRADLVAAEAMLAKAEADWRLQRAMRIPDPTAMFTYEHEPPEAINTIGLGLSFPLPLWNHNRGAIKAAQAARDQAAIQLDKVKAQIAAEIISARAGSRDATRRYDTYRREIRPKSAEILKTVSFAYEKGGASLLDLLSAQRNDNEVRLATVQAAADAAVAQATLRSVQEATPTNADAHHP
jgi:outer membrane protein, heavy metal efflux system